MPKITIETLCSLVEVNAETGKIFWKYRPLSLFKSQRDCNAWNARFAGKEGLTGLSGKGYRSGRIGGVTCFAHVIIWAVRHNIWPSNQIDHINHDKTDNRISNLRPVTNRDNCRNASLSKRNSSGHIGVSWESAQRKWRSGIMVDGRNKFLGYFDNIEDAAKARSAASLKYGFHPNHGRKAA